MNSKVHRSTYCDYAAWKKPEGKLLRIIGILRRCYDRYAQEGRALECQRKTGGVRRVRRPCASSETQSPRRIYSRERHCATASAGAMLHAKSVIRRRHLRCRTCGHQVHDGVHAAAKTPVKRNGPDDGAA